MEEKVKKEKNPNLRGSIGCTTYSPTRSPTPPDSTSIMGSIGGTVHPHPSLPPKRTA
ncbi:hypothetical protein CHS0354_016077 [Potamilus streckersoni]|uniref:Uncharacterized protein n=1 Tax=Potamilus streckersoni TaxID=2493646 RepID=A0AAE0T0V1_9BIVA|nr:hypothetical protein CHS0354_016077 [Potamilus streckersoni]